MRGIAEAEGRQKGGIAEAGWRHVDSGWNGGMGKACGYGVEWWQKRGARLRFGRCAAKGFIFANSKSLRQMALIDFVHLLNEITF